ncbi:MAG: ATP-binding cassette domain-containing protein [Armatimonadota bacterium]|nr:ATP-binding cassette domain-containing protein [Armatimonadota bacterium]
MAEAHLRTPQPPADEAIVVVRDVWKRFGTTQALAGVSLEVRRGQVQVIMGPSGCGKSVLLKHLVGLLRPDRGTIHVFGQPVHALPDEDLDALRMRVGVVFQSAALFDSMTVAENVAFPLRRHRRLAGQALRARVDELLALVGLTGAGELLPAQLSGGMRKRVGIARALALAPDLLLYDEPTGGLDPITARTVDELILRLRADLGTTAVVVTHDLASAFRLADELAVMDAGRLVAAGTPAAIRASAHPFVQRFLASGAEVVSA